MVQIALCMEHAPQRDIIIHEIESTFTYNKISFHTLICSNAEELLSKTQNNFCPDILLYDINGENGKAREAALSLKKKNSKLISIVTEKTDYIHFEDNIILQPIYSLPNRCSSQLWHYLCKTYQLLSSDIDSFTYYRRPEYTTVALDDVLYFNSEGRKIHLVTVNGSDSFYYKLDEVEQLLQNKKHHFARVHKSYLVNTDYITEYDKRTLTLETGQILNISRYDHYQEVNRLKRNLEQ